MELALKGRVNIFCTESENYSRSVIKIAEMVSRNKQRICYVTLNRGYENLKGRFASEGVDTSRFFFVDCASGSGKSSCENEPVLYLESPKSLTELSIAIKNVVKAGNIECVIFDSLSTLILYKERSIVVRFFHSLISDVRFRETSYVFIVVKNRESEEMLKDISMMADEVIDIDER